LPQDVVEDEDVGIAHRFHRLRIVTDRRRVLADLDLRKTTPMFIDWAP